MRFDIQFLRGLAVVLVVLYHADIIPLPAGFLGVDIFFVISGFLITTIILRGIDNGSFTFKGFYTRRAKRLLPAAYSTLIITSLISYEFLTRAQWLEYFKQLFGSLTFSANMFLLFQSGYFDDSAESKPLLHMWSLSLEEQYYLFLPLLLVFLPKRWRTSILVFGTILSISLCIYVVNREANIAFYTLPTRIWELLIGSLGAWLMIKNSSLNIPKNLKLSLLLILILISLFPLDNLHPGIDAIIVVFITIILILGADNWLAKNTITGVVAKLGDWSYSLYLVHWPLFAFANNAFLGNIPDYIKVFIVFVSVSLAYMQYTYVEQPFRYGWKANNNRTLVVLSLFTILVLAVPIPKYLDFNHVTNDGSVDFSTIRQANFGLGIECEQRGNEYVEREECKTSAKPKIAVWGDSYAMHLIPGLMNNPKVRNDIVQITKSSCGPVRGIAFVNFKYLDSWAQECIDFNESAYQYMIDTDSIKYVVMSSPFVQYFRELDQKYYYDGETHNKVDEIAIKKFVKTVNELKKHNKVPIIVGPSPSAFFNIGDCHERLANELVMFGREGCNFTVIDYHKKFRQVIQALNEVEKRTNVKIYWPHSVNCSDEMCVTKLDNIYLYRDEGHFTVAGSQLMVKKMGLIDQLLNQEM